MISNFKFQISNRLALLALTLLTLATLSKAATFAWNANTESDIQYYRLYVGTNSGGYTTSFVSIGQGANLTVANSVFVIGRTNYAALTAVNTAGVESLRFSAEISFVITNAPAVAIPPASPAGLKYIGQ